MALADNISKKYLYDPNVGRWTREVKGNFTTAAGTRLITGNSAIASALTALVAGNREWLVTSLVLSSSDADKVFDITDGTSTLGMILVTPDNNIRMSGSNLAPIFRIGGTSTLTFGIEAGAGSATISIFVSGIVYPKPEALDPR